MLDAAHPPSTAEATDAFIMHSYEKCEKKRQKNA